MMFSVGYASSHTSLPVLASCWYDDICRLCEFSYITSSAACFLMCRLCEFSHITSSAALVGMMISVGYVSSLTSLPVLLASCWYDVFCRLCEFSHITSSAACFLLV